MNKFLIFTIIIFFIGIVFLLPRCEIETIYDLTLSDDETIKAGEGETCLTPYSEIQCEKGLECILISTTPYRNGMCLKPETILEEDFINRDPNRK